MYLIVTEKQECMMFDFWEGEKKREARDVHSKDEIEGLAESLQTTETEPSSCIYSCFQSGIRRECSDLIITSHYVYRYSTIPLMEHLFMSTLFGINTVINVFHSIYSLLFTWSLCLVNKKTCCLIITLLKFSSVSGRLLGRSYLKSIQREICLICRVIANRWIMEEKS